MYAFTRCDITIYVVVLPSKNMLFNITIVMNETTNDREFKIIQYIVLFVAKCCMSTKHSDDIYLTIISIRLQLTVKYMPVEVSIRITSNAVSYGTHGYQYNVVLVTVNKRCNLTSFISSPFLQDLCCAFCIVCVISSVFTYHSRLFIAMALGFKHATAPIKKHTAQR